MTQANEVPLGLEWLASVAEREMDRRREEIVRTIVANDKKARHVSKTFRPISVAKSVRKPGK